MDDILAFLAIQQAAAGSGSNLNYYSEFTGSSNVSGSGSLRCIQMSPDGTKLFVKFSMAAGIHQYNLSTAFDFSTIDYNYIQLSGSQSFENSFCFGSNGTILWTFAGSQSRLYNLSTPYDFTNAFYTGTSVTAEQTLTNNPGFSGAKIYAGCFNSTGSRFYVVGLASSFNPNSSGLYIVHLSNPYDLSLGNLVASEASSPNYFKPTSAYIGDSTPNFIDIDNSGLHLLYSLDTQALGYSELVLVSQDSFLDSEPRSVSSTALAPSGFSTAPKAPGEYFEQAGSGYFVTHDGMYLNVFKGPPLSPEVTVTEGIFSSIMISSGSNGPGSVPDSITLYFNNFNDVELINTNFSITNSTVEVVYQGTKYTFMSGAIVGNVNGPYSWEFQSLTEYSSTYVGYGSGGPSSGGTFKLITYSRGGGGGGGGGGGDIPIYRYYVGTSGPLVIEFTDMQARDAAVTALATVGSNPFTLDGYNLFFQASQITTISLIGGSMPPSTNSYQDGPVTIYIIMYSPGSFNWSPGTSSMTPQGAGTLILPGGGGGGGGGGVVPPPGGSAILRYFATQSNNFLRLDFTDITQRANALAYIGNLPGGSYAIFNVYGPNEGSGQQEQWEVVQNGSGYNMGDFFDPNINTQVYYASFSNVSLNYQGSNMPGYLGVV